MIAAAVEVPEIVIIHYELFQRFACDRAHESLSVTAQVP